MTYPRSHMVDPNGGIYHVCSQCVRRAFLCGIDKETGFNFNHRRTWLENRIHQLAEIFAVDLFGYAVMSNHYHLVLRIDPNRVDSWSDQQIADKWLTLYPRKRNHPNANQIRKLAMDNLLSDPERLLVLRDRLSSLSWFMSCLNEPLARLANKEDRCKGRFWEGRFKSQQILDEASLLACMVYVDLNPIRAGIEKDILTSEHTSVSYRAKHHDMKQSIRALNAPFEALPSVCSLEDYLELIVWTALAQQNERPISKIAQRTLERANSPDPILWLEHYLPKPNHWQRALGSFSQLQAHAEHLNQRWIRTRSAHLRCLEVPG